MGEVHYRNDALDARGELHELGVFWLAPARRWRVSGLSLAPKFTVPFVICVDALARFDVRCS